MPNWCTNYVDIKTDDPALFQAMLKRIETAKDATDHHQGFFQGFIPCPDELLDDDLTTWGHGDEQIARDAKKAAMVEKYGYPSWYDWRIEKWGTKWDVRDIEGDSVADGSLIQIQFDTAWSPPLEIFEEMKRLGYYVEAQYIDEGGFFVGDWIDGVDNSYPCDNPPEHLEHLCHRWEDEDDAA